jgi:hypothetical protein
VRSTSHLVVFVAVALSAGELAACGGKIAGDGRSSSGSDPNASGATTSRGGGSGSGGSGSGGVVFPAPASSSSDQSPSGPFTPPPSSSGNGLGQPPDGPSVYDACAAICERNAKCGADSPDCAESCSSEIHGATTCAAQANAYIRCYAANLDSGCAELPPVCENAYCAYTICAGKVVPGYCR